MTNVIIDNASRLNKWTMRHSNIFCMATILVILFSQSIALLPHAILLGMIVFSIALIGVPHGALDILFAKQHWKLNTVFRWFVFLLTYLMLVALVVVLWLWQPIVFFVGFLIISIMHFADDCPASTPKIIKILQGGALIVLPSLMFNTQMAQLFSYFISQDASIILVEKLRSMAFLWCLGLLASALWLLKRDRRVALEVISTSFLALLVTPLVAFTLYFCGLHSIRHILRSEIFLKPETNILKITGLVAPSVATIIIAALCWNFLPAATLNGQLIQIIFVSLAALTLPHMLILYLSGFVFWNKGEGTQQTLP
jgi:beta-carotene 15,15'-dioxygenase